MKRCFLIVVFLLTSIINSNAQFVTIPDTNFVNWLNNNGFAGCMNGNLMDTTCLAVVNDTSINCSSANINDLTGIEYFDNLSELQCHNNHLSSLPTLPSFLKILSCGNNNLFALPALPSSLTNLNCSQNWITSLPLLPSSLINLSCSENSLSSLPTLPSSLTTLFCPWNGLTSLPTLPSSLTSLYCSFNWLTSIPSLPSSLAIFKCNNNLLTSLPTLPPSLTDLRCYYNSLTSIPSLPSSLAIFECNNNLLTSLPILNITMYGLNISNNPGIKCLPPIHQLTYFYWGSTSIECFPNHISTLNASPSITNIPICNFFNHNNCDIYWNIGGNSYNDSISNCLNDSIDPICRNIKINLYSNGNLVQQTFSNALGEFTFDTDTGTYIYAPDTNTVYHLVCPISGVHNSQLTALDSIDTDMDFSLECKPGFDVGVTSILRAAGIFRPAGFTSVKISAGDLSNHFGLHCAGGVSGEVKVLINGPASFINPLSGALTPTLSGDTLIYSISDFGLVDYNTAFGLYVQTDTTAQLLQQVCFEVWVTPSGDNVSTNNHLTQCFNVVNSYDPNDKQVSPEYIEDANGEWLTYTVRFQNTGNAPANHIYILDTLSQFVDASTFEIITYSHEPLTVLTGNAIRFNFAGINLPDSVSNEPGSHGYVQYRVRSLPGLPNNTSVANTAYIYFDFNPPVVTNTANSLVHCLENRTVSQTICHGESFSFNNVNLQYPGVYLDTIYNTNGCDTIVYLDLNVTYQNINTIQNGNTLQVLNSGTYQWINCSNNTSISGQTNNTFNPTANGNYAVVVTNGSCVDTSSCINFVISGVTEISSTPIKLSPNPAGEYILLENLPINKCQITVHDITGRVVSTINYESSKQQLNVASLSKGVYLIEITGKDVYERLYFVKE